MGLAPHAGPLPLGSGGYEADASAKGERKIWVKDGRH
jgi:hypothetical protein